jgi:Tol biopolymer transport system component
LIAAATVVTGFWFVEFGPILNPPNPRVEAAVGITIRQVWANPNEDYNLGAGLLEAVPSADGRYISLVNRETGDLGILDLAKEELLGPIDVGGVSGCPNGALESIFSPDGKQIAYTCQTEDWGCQLLLIALTESKPRILFQDDSVRHMFLGDWSEDGSHILAILADREDGGSLKMVLISVADGAVSTLKDMDRTLPWRMSLSPDLRYVVFDHPEPEKGLGRDIFLLSTEDGREIPLVQSSARDQFPLWTPDGNYVVFASDRRGGMGLWIQRVLDGRQEGWPKLVKSDIGLFVPTGFTQDGALYYLLSTGTFDTYLAGIDLEEGRIKEEPTGLSPRFVGFNVMPDWTDDGRFLAYLSNRGNFWYSNDMADYRIVIRKVATGEERELSLDFERHVRSFSWSPDGCSFMVRGRSQVGSPNARPRYGVFKIDATTGETVVILEREPKANRWESQANWSSDGQSIYYSLGERHVQSTRQSLRLRDIETAEETELLRAVSPEGFSGLGLSRNGQRLAFVWEHGETGSRALRIIPSAGGQSTELYRVDDPDALISPGSLEWTPNDREILFVRKIGSESNEQTFELMAVSTHDGSLRGLGPIMADVRELRLHPDGSQLAFTAGRMKLELWAIEGFLPED